MEGFRLFTTIRYDPELQKVPVLEFGNFGWNQTLSPFYMLNLHRDRVLKAARHWGWHAAVRAVDGEAGLRRVEGLLQDVASRAGDGPYRIKLLVSKDGTLTYEIGATPPTRSANLFPTCLPTPNGENAAEVDGGMIPSEEPGWEILVDPQPTPRSEFTHFKTTHRLMYDEARERASIGPTDQKEVLLVNAADGSIMEGSFSTPYFWRDGKWVTPPVSRDFDLTLGSGGNDGTTRRWALEQNLVMEQIVPADSLTDGEECWFSTGVRGFVFGRVKLESTQA